MTAYYNENNPHAAAWLRNLIVGGLIPHGHVDERSIVDVQAGDLRGFRHVHMFAGIGGWALAGRLAGWPEDREWWTGSCPCQPFSVAGKGAGKDDPRHLWPDFFRLIGACRPACVMGEQVSRKAGKGWFDGVRSDLEAIGYASRAIDIPACAVDAPHIRSRLWWCAVADAVRGGPATHGRDNHEIGRVPEKECKPGYDASLSGRSNAAAIRGLALPNGERHEWREGNADRRLNDRPNAGRLESYSAAACCHERSGGLEHTPSIGRGEGRPQSEFWSGRPAAGRPDASGVALGDANGQGLAIGRGQPGHPGPECPAAKRADGCNGSFWSDYEWLLCHDGKARRAQPSIPLLVDGVPGRVALWRGLGNAIAPPLAAEIIKAFLDCQP